MLNDEGTSVYAYKADGLRLSKDVNGEKTTHVWDGSNIVLEYGANTDVYLRGINLIKSSAQGYYLFNAHGDVVQRADNSGSVVKSYVYDAFGVEKDVDAGDTNPFRYCAEYFDVETGTIYLRMRYYQPSLGAFMSEDPIRDGLNWYTYCMGNPLMFLDPLGLALVNIVDYAKVMGATTSIYQKNGKNYITVRYNGITQNYTYYNSGKVDDTVLNERFGWSSFLTDKDRDAGVEIYISNGMLYRDVTKPLSAALGKTTDDAKQRAQQSVKAGMNFRGGATMGMTNAAIWFYNQVKPGAPWDIKLKNRWEGTIGSTFPGRYDTPVYYEGWLTTPEELGNYTFGFIGGAVGFSAEILYAGSWYAAGTPFGGAEWVNEFNDWNAIKRGYDKYRSIF